MGIKSGVGGALVLLALSTLIAFAFAGLGAMVALRFGSGDAVQAIFPLLINSPGKRLVMLPEATHHMMLEKNRLMALGPEPKVMHHVKSGLAAPVAGQMFTTPCCLMGRWSRGRPLNVVQVKRQSTDSYEAPPSPSETR